MDYTEFTSDLSDESIFSEITIDMAEGYKWRIELMYRDFVGEGAGK